PPRSMQHKNSDLDKYSDYSEEKYDYDEEEDLRISLSKYKHAKESSGHGKAGPKDQAKSKISGRSCYCLVLIQDSRGPPSFQKKRPIMSQEFINQHTFEHNGRHICKYFLEGRCIKGDQCKFEHDNVVPEKKKELCKFYVQGYCTKGDICIYIVSEYPCKFFHTGAKCYQGDNCKFSHEPLTDVTKELLEKVWTNL
uniref:C3H1-type domain-containing protein n=1 Tax=Sinocyclocheilus grahami TaxID=75366 RepID=A0A672KVU9_SINGR